MDITEKLLRFKFHILAAFAISFSAAFVCYLAPRSVDVLKYFSPLLVSTAIFLVAAVVFDRTSQLSGEYSGEGLLDYVAGEVEPGLAAAEVGGESVEGN